MGVTLTLFWLKNRVKDAEPDAQMLRELFGYSMRNQYELRQPDNEARSEFFAAIIEYIRKSPPEFPLPEARKKRKGRKSKNAA